MKKMINKILMTILGVAMVFIVFNNNAQASGHYPASCTLSKTKSSDVLVVFNNAAKGYGLISTEQTSTWSDVLYQKVSIPTGKYSVKLQSFDGYEGRSSVAQTNERFWVLLASNNGTKAIASTGVSGDVPDYKEQAYWTGNVGNITVSETVDMISLRHVNPYPNSEPNSHIPVCMLLTNITPQPVDGQCSSTLNGKYLDLKPTSGLCSKGTASAVTGNGSTANPWKWSCSGVNGGTVASCSALKKLTPVNGECNSQYNGKVLSQIPPTGSLCTKGQESTITGDGSSTNPWKWSCSGLEGGTNANCSATQRIEVRPSIQIIKDDNDNHDDTQTIAEKGTATFSIKITNNGNIDLTDVVVTDQLSPNCNKTIGNLVKGATATYTCTISNVVNSFTNTAVVNGKAGTLSVTDTDDSKVVVTPTPINGECNSTLNGKILESKPTTDLCTKGTASTVTGTGTQNDPWKWSCSGINGGTNANCSATKKEIQSTPSIKIIKDDNGNHDDTQRVNQGESAYFSIVITNNGTERLTNISVTDDLSPNCSKTVDQAKSLIETKYGSGHNYLNPNETFSYVCEDTNVQSDYTNTAVVNGQGTTSNVTDSDTSNVIIGTSCEPEIYIVKDDNDNHDDTQTIQEGGTATFSIKVSNRGTERLTNISVTDDLSPNCSKTVDQAKSLIETKYGSGHNYLDPLEFFEYICTKERINNSFVNTAVATGKGNSETVTSSNTSNVVVTPNPINGECNSNLNGKLLESKPTSGLCTKGTASAVTGTGTQSDPWKWSCGGLNGGNKANCSALKKAQENPSIQIIKDDNDNHDDTQTIQEGGVATFSIKITNNGNIDLTDVVVTDQLSPNCNKTIGNLAVNETKTYTCTIENVTQSFVNVAVVNGKTGTTTNVTNSNNSNVVVTKTPTNGVCNSDLNGKILEEKPATNLCTEGTASVLTGDGSIANPWKWSCGGIAGGTSSECSASKKIPVVNGECNSQYNGKVLSQIPPTGSLCTKGQESAITGDGSSTNLWKWSCSGLEGGTAASCSANAITPNPSIKIVKDDNDANNHDDTQTIQKGSTAKFNIYVTNNGNVRLTDVVVKDEKAPNCNLTAEQSSNLINQKYGHTYLDPNENFHYECIDTNVDSGYTNIAIVNAKNGNNEINNSDTSDVVVDCNCKTTDVSIIKEARDGSDSQTIDEGEDAYFRITVKNTGTARLNDVYVNDAKASNCNVSTSEAANLINQKYGHTYLDPNESFSYECKDNDVDESYTNMAIVTATSENGTDQSSDSTNIKVENIDSCNASIGDFVWNDRDKDGVQDSSEEGISGVRLKLYHGNDLVKEYTDSQGFYEFNNLCKGKYDVVIAAETLPSGCYQTYDRDGHLDQKTTVDLDSGEDYTLADFGYYCPTNTVVTSGTTSPATGTGMLAGGIATLFAAGSALFSLRRAKFKA